MKNVTIALEDTVFDHANQRAAEMHKSLETVMREYAEQFGLERQEFERLKRLEAEVMEQIKDRGFSASDRLSREELYDSARTRWVPGIAESD